MKFLGVLLGAAVVNASSKGYKKLFSTAEIEQKRLYVESQRLDKDAGGTCEQQALKCKTDTAGRRECICHGLKETTAKGKKKITRCVLKSKAKFPSGVLFKHNSVGFCREKMDNCPNRTPEIRGGLLECKGNGCFPNQSGEKCMNRNDMCLKKLNGKRNCKHRGKHYAEVSFSKKTCCRTCYRKRKGVDCLYEYVESITKKQRGPRGVLTWLPDWKSMKRAKTHLCCMVGEPKEFVSYEQNYGWVNLTSGNLIRINTNKEPIPGNDHSVCYQAVEDFRDVASRSSHIANMFDPDVDTAADCHTKYIQLIAIPEANNTKRGCFIQKKAVKTSDWRTSAFYAQACNSGVNTCYYSWQYDLPQSEKDNGVPRSKIDLYKNHNTDNGPVATFYDLSKGKCDHVMYSYIDESK